MPRIKAKTKEPTYSDPSQDLIESYKKEFKRWSDVLEVWHTNRFDKNYRQYTGNIDIKGTTSNISDPVAPELVERVNQKLFEREPKFYAQAPGHNLPKEITSIMTGTAQYYWNNPDVVQSTGTSRAKTKVVGREFLITGNAGTETYFNVGADSPDFRALPIEDVIFDPSKSLKTSPVYYIRQFVDLAELEALAEVVEGGKVVSGIFKKDAIEALKKELEGSDGVVEDDRTSNQVNRSGSESFRKVSNKIELTTRWAGKKCCRIANWKHLLQEYESALGDDPLDFVMDIEVPKQPYALSLLDFISGLTTAKDLILNQVVDYGAKALNPPLFVDPNLPPVNRATLRNAYKVGGIVFAPPGMAEHKPMPSLPSMGFDLMTYIQQRSESTTGIGAYTGGVPNQSSDKTQGTKGGILALIEQAASPIRDRQLNLEESIIEPVVNKMLKMAGHLMSDKESKFVFITGEQPKWVRITKGLLTGKITLQDLRIAEIIDDESYQQLGQEMTANGIDPSTHVMWDLDWVIRVEAGSMAETDSEQERQAMQEWVAFNAQFGVPMDLMKISKEMGIKAGIKEPDQYLMQDNVQPGTDPQAQMQQDQMQMQAQMQGQTHEQQLAQQQEAHQQQLKQNEETHQMKLAQEMSKLDESRVKVMQGKAKTATISADRISR